MGIFNLADSVPGRGQRMGMLRGLVICGLALVYVAVLCHSGAGLVSGSDASEEAPATSVIQKSPELFTQYCSACHPDGGNKFKARFPLKKAPQLADFETFLAYIRAPKARDGSPTVMMQFPDKILSEPEARAIYEYIVQVLKRG